MLRRGVLCYLVASSRRNLSPLANKDGKQRARKLFPVHDPYSLRGHCLHHMLYLQSKDVPDVFLCSKQVMIILLCWWCRCFNNHRFLEAPQVVFLRVWLIGNLEYSLSFPGRIIVLSWVVGLVH